MAKGSSSQTNDPKTGDGSNAGANDTPGAFQAGGGLPAERRSDSLVQGPGTGSSPAQDGLTATDPVLSGRKTQLQSDAETAIAQGKPIPGVSVAGPQTDKTHVNPDTSGEPIQRKAPGKGGLNSQLTGLTRFQVWPHGGVRRHGKRVGPGGFIDLTKDEAEELNTRNPGIVAVTAEARLSALGVADDET